MKQKDVPHAMSVFVCTHGGGGKKCHGGKKLFAYLRKEVKRRKLNHQIHVSASGCMDQCEKGPNIMAFPDNIWLCRVRERDLDGFLDDLESRLPALSKEPK